LYPNLIFLSGQTSQAGAAPCQVEASLAECSTLLRRDDPVSVYSIVEHAQTLAIGWSLSGDIRSEINLTSTSPYSGSGIAMLQITIEKDAFDA